MPPQVQEITKSGDTLMLQKRVALWRLGIFMAGEFGGDIGGIFLPTNLNNPSIRALYEPNGIGASWGAGFGAIGRVNLAAIVPSMPSAQDFALSLGLGYMERNGLWTASILANPQQGTNYEVFRAMTQVQALYSHLLAEYHVGSGVSATGGFTLAFPLRADAEIRFQQQSISDVPPRTRLNPNALLWGITAGLRYDWRIRSMSTTQMAIVPFFDVHWQPHILTSNLVNNNALWSALTFRLGASLQIAPMFTDTVQIIPYKKPHDALHTTDTTTQTFSQSPQPRIITEATQLPSARMNDSILAEETFLYNTVLPTNTDILPRSQEFLQTIFTDLASNLRFRLLFSTLASERDLAEKRVASVIRYLREQNIPPERVESRIIERTFLESGQRLTVQVLR